MFLSTSPARLSFSRLQAQVQLCPTCVTKHGRQVAGAGLAHLGADQLLVRLLVAEGRRRSAGGEIEPLQELRCERARLLYNGPVGGERTFKI